MAKSFKIAGVQMDVREGKPQQNFDAMLASFEETLKFLWWKLITYCRQ